MEKYREFEEEINKGGRPKIHDDTSVSKTFQVFGWQNALLTEVSKESGMSHSEILRKILTICYEKGIFKKVEDKVRDMGIDLPERRSKE